MIKLLTYVTTFLIIILAELGDKTQVATLIYASNNPRKRWHVFLAAAGALIACVTLEVTLGVYIARMFSPSLINRIAGVVFILIGLFALNSSVKELKSAPPPLKESPNETKSPEPPFKKIVNADQEN